MNHGPIVDEALSAREVDPIAVRVKEGFSRMDALPDQVLRAIHDEAVRHLAARSRRNHLQKVVRWTALAASLLVMSGFVVQLHAARKTHAETVALIKIGTADSFPNMENAESEELSNLLLNAQGLDRESFFTADETGLLWL